jgi:hypothetical protein
VTAGVDAPGALAEDEGRNVVKRMLVPVAHRGAVDNQRLVEQRPVTAGRRVQLVEEVSQHLHVIDVDLRLLLDEPLVVPRMGDDVVLLGLTERPEYLSAQLASHHERKDTGRVRLKGQHQQVEHQLRMRFPIRWRVGRALWQLHDGLVGPLGSRDALLDLANGVEVLDQPETI